MPISSMPVNDPLINKFAFTKRQLDDLRDMQLPKRPSSGLSDETLAKIAKHVHAAKIAETFLSHRMSNGEVKTQLKSAAAAVQRAIDLLGWGSTRELAHSQLSGALAGVYMRGNHIPQNLPEPDGRSPKAALQKIECLRREIIELKAALEAASELPPSRPGPRVPEEVRLQIIGVCTGLADEGVEIKRGVNADGVLYDFIEYAFGAGGVTLSKSSIDQCIRDYQNDRGPCSHEHLKLEMPD